MNLLAAPAKAPRTTAGLRARAAVLPPGTWAWFAAAVSLVLAGNALLSRRLLMDSFYDLSAGRYVAQHGIPHQNVLTVASHGAAWIDQQWLAQLCYYGSWAIGGYPAVAALSAMLVTAGFAVLALLMLRRGVPAARMFAWTIAAFAVCLGNTGIRAQSFAYPLFALILWLVVTDSEAPRPRARTWLIIPVLVLWANTHGSVLLGVALAGLYAGYRAALALARKDPRSIVSCLALGTAAAVALLCTPYGPGIIGYYRLFVGSPALTRYIEEWAQPSPLNPWSWAFIAVTVAALIAVVAGWRRGTRPDPLLSGLALVLAALAVTGMRYQAWSGFASSLLAADTLARTRAGQMPALGVGFRRVTAGLLGALAVISLGTLAVTPGRQFEQEISRRAIDVAAALAGRNPAVRILGDDWSGSPLLWLHPAVVGRVGFDARLEQYTPAALSAYSDFLYVRGPHWQRVMRGYRIIVVSSSHHPKLISALGRLPGWRVAYRDHDGVVLLRQPAQAQGLP